MAIGNHATYVKIQNFKGFTDLEVKDLGWVNLIVGDNNTGKTSLLEALHFHSDESTGLDIFRSRLIKILKEVRGIQDFQGLFLDFFINRTANAPSIGTEMAFQMKYRNLGEIHYSLLYNGKEIKNQALIHGDTHTILPHNKGMQNVNNAYSNAAIPYIPVNRGYGADLVSNYSAYIQQHTTLKRQLKKDLEILIPQLESFEPSEITQPATIIFFLRDSEGSVALPMMGEGAIKLFRILSEILTWKGQRLMIDEIDTGFHHSRMRPFWKTILNAAQRHETQLFVTTHNLECIQHLRDTLREDMPDFKDEVRVIRLAKVLAGTKAYTYTYPEFESALENENELR